MPRFALAIEYNGKKFHGSQFQPEQRTVQGELENALSIALRRKDVKTIFSGRTDSGVHANNQIVHFDLDNTMAPDEVSRLELALNGILAKDLAVKKIVTVANHFHARNSAISRRYVYRILNRRQRSALFKDTHFFVHQKLNLLAMQKALVDLKGEHDFAAFCSSNRDYERTICKVLDANILNLGEGRLEFWIEADHFVYNMVRIIVGTLIEIGLNERSPKAFGELIATKDRRLAGITAPPWGLMLYSVKYPDDLAFYNDID